jgi:flagellar assembly protein FliH
MKTWHDTVVLEEPLIGAVLASLPPCRDGREMERQLKTKYEEGVRAGEERLRGQLLQQRNELLDIQRGILQSLERSLPQVRAECEGSLVELALETANRLVAGMPVTPEIVAASVREALAEVEDTHEITVLLHPDDLALLKGLNPEASDDSAISSEPRNPVHWDELIPVGAEKTRFEGSPEVTRGGCMVQTRFGIVDGRRETKFARLRECLLS